MAGLISRGTYIGGLSWAAARWVGLLHYLPNLKRSHRALSWLNHIFSPPEPNTNWLSQGCVLETSLSLGQQWAERIFEGQKRGWGAFDFPGPAGGSIYALVLLITSSQQKPGSPEITMQLGSPRHPHGCSSRTETYKQPTSLKLLWTPQPSTRCIHKKAFKWLQPWSASDCSHMVTLSKNHHLSSLTSKSLINSMGFHSLTEMVNCKPGNRLSTTTLCVIIEMDLKGKFNSTSFISDSQSNVFWLEIDCVTFFKNNHHDDLLFHCPLIFFLKK